MDDILFADFGTGVPLIVVVLVAGGVYFSFFFGWMSIRGFLHAIQVIRGRYDDPKDPGEISHFQALTSALSATIGLGNIAGVAIAVGSGGTRRGLLDDPHRPVRDVFKTRFLHAGGHVPQGSSGRPYIRRSDVLSGAGAPEKGASAPRPHTGHVCLRFLTIGGIPGGREHVPGQPDGGDLQHGLRGLQDLQLGGWSLLVSILVGVVIIGGIRRIGRVTSRIVPFMCLAYVITSSLIILAHLSDVPEMIAKIRESLHGACYLRRIHRNPGHRGEAGGLLERGRPRVRCICAFGSAKTDEPAREGMVAMIGPFIDTSSSV